MAKNIEMNIKGSDGSYEVLYPAVTNGSINIDSSLMSQYNIDGNSFNDFVSWIGKYNLYWWKRRVNTYNQQYIEQMGENLGAAIVFSAQNGTFPTITINYSKSITVNQETGAITLNNPLSVNLEKGTVGYYPLIGSYFTSNNYGSMPQTETEEYKCLPGLFYYCDSGSYGYSPSIGNYECKVLYNVHQVTSTLSTSGTIGDWEEYFQSNEENIYPNGGIQNGYEYQLFGVPLDNSIAPVKIETGNYTGTGTYNGDTRATSLTLSFQPKMVFITRQPSGSESSQQTFQYAQFYRLIDENSYVIYSGFNGGMSASTSGSLTNLRVKFDGNTIKWYSTNSTNQQMNSTGVVYYYLAIG